MTPQPFAQKINNALCGFPNFIASKLLPFMEKLSFIPLFGLRLWIANIFWKSGLTKIADWETTISLFEEEYKVPFISTELAAYLATGVELGAPILLLIGLGSRFSAAALLVVTLIIECTYMSFEIHKIWALVSLIIIFQGPGVFSVDYLIRKFFKPANKM